MKWLITQPIYIIAFFLLISIISRFIQAESPQNNLIDLSIEELMEVEVTTASKIEKIEVIRGPGGVIWAMEKSLDL